jgi:RNA polymerase sigma-70 factor (ECF subfamily)
MTDSPWHGRLEPVRRLRLTSNASARTADLSVEALIGRSARGDDDAFARLYDATAAAVFGTVVRVVRDRSQSEEVVQEAYLEIWRHAARFDPAAGSGRTWVLTIAHRRAVDRVRWAQAATERERRASEQSAARAYDDVVETVERSLEAEQLRRCLDGLTELQRESVTLAYYRGYTYPEVARLLDTPLGTVKTRMRDGLIRLRDCLGVSQ